MGLNFWPKSFWPPQSTDLNSLGYSVCAHVEGKACKVRNSSVNDLKAFVNLVCSRMSKDNIRDECSAFRARMERVLAANGGRMD